jgi:DNA-binding CsgD family transcriptional regulator
MAEACRHELGPSGDPCHASGKRAGPHRRQQRVADLVAAGHTNPETPPSLFRRRCTVEAHLSRVYRKLGERSRTELCRILMFERPTAATLTPVAWKHARFTDSSRAVNTYSHPVGRPEENPTPIGRGPAERLPAALA